MRILDETALLACAAYVDLNPIRAALAETLETNDYTSAQRRIESLTQKPAWYYLEWSAFDPVIFHFEDGRLE